MSQSSTGSVRDFLPDNCFLNLDDDDDEGTLNLVTKFTDTYFNRPLPENELDRANSDDSSSDSDSDSDVDVPFDLRGDDVKFDSDLQRFREAGCGCQLDDGRILCYFCFINTVIIEASSPEI